jgi:hypothetical protein
MALRLPGPLTPGKEEPNMAEQPTADMDFKFDRSNLYQEESFTDLKVGTIRRLTPVKPDGSPDKTRKTVFIGQTHLMTPHGSVPLQSAIKAKDLPQAIKRFPEAMDAAVDNLVEEVKKMKESEQSPIITPGAGEQSRIIVPGR